MRKPIIILHRHVPTLILFSPLSYSEENSLLSEINSEEIDSPSYNMRLPEITLEMLFKKNQKTFPLKLLKTPEQLLFQFSDSISTRLLALGSYPPSHKCLPPQQVCIMLAIQGGRRHSPCVQGIILLVQFLILTSQHTSYNVSCYNQWYHYWHTDDNEWFTFLCWQRSI